MTRCQIAIKLSVLFEFENSQLSGPTGPSLSSDVEHNETVEARVHIETIILYQLSSTKFITQNDVHQQYQYQCVVILIETKFINYKCLQMRFWPWRSMIEVNARMARRANVSRANCSKGVRHRNTGKKGRHNLPHKSSLFLV